MQKDICHQILDLYATQKQQQEQQQQQQQNQQKSTNGNNNDKKVSVDLENLFFKFSSSTLPMYKIKEATSFATNSRYSTTNLP